MDQTKQATTLEQQTQEQGAETEEQAKNMPEKEVKEPEIGVDENGNLIINDESFFPEGLKSEEETEQAKNVPEEKKEEVKTEEKEEKKSPKDYPDTIEEDGITKYKVVVQGEVQYVPLEELIKGYQRQSDYTKKTQKLSEERKKLEEEKRKVEEILKTVELAANYNLTREELLDINNKAAEIVKSQYGIDEYDDNYDSLKTLVAQQMAQQLKQQKEAREKFMKVEEYLKAKDPDYEEISQLVLEKIENELPLKKVRELEIAKQKGDPMPFLELYRTVAEEYRRSKQKQQQQPEQKTQEGQGLFSQQAEQLQAQPQQKKVEPPVTEVPTNMTEAPSQTAINPEELAYKTVDEQVKLLLEMGLV